MNDNTESPRCEWKQDVDCPFHEAIHEYQGRNYCRVHTPDPHGKTLDWVKGKLLVARDSKEKHLNGLVVPDFGAGHGDLAVHGLSLDGSTFFGAETFQVRYPGASFKNAHFAGKTHFKECDGTLELQSAVFEEACVISIAGGAKLVLRDATFRGSLHIKLKPTAQVVSLDCRNGTFASAPEISGSVLPQATNFAGAKFLPQAFHADAEPTFRSIRVRFGNNKSREMEGVFYAHEKRCHRKSLRPGIAKALSALYDWTSSYGQSYERALSGLAVVQVLFGIVYSWMSGRLRFGPIDWTIVNFTFAQVLKPFDLYTSKGQLSGVSAEILGRRPMADYWLLVTAVHSLVSLSLVALALLALRWRFRRE